MSEYIIDKKEEVNKLIERLKLFSFDALIKNQHYEYSLLEKNTDEKMIRETYNKFDLINLIKKRIRPNGKVSYDLFYELKDNTFVVITISFQTSPPTIINAFHAKRDFKKFRKSLSRNYRINPSF